jgi:YesN/AraC family two-component response regulator
LAQSLKLGDPEWSSRTDQLFLELTVALPTREDTIHLIDYFIYFMQKELAELPAEFLDVWERGALQPLNRIIEEEETLDEIYAKLNQVLAELHDKLTRLRESRSNHLMLNKVKRHIESHYSNPDLSLNHLTEAFGLSPRYLSKLFKEEFGEKFIDYMVKVRMDNAKRLLVETTYSIQEIGEQVGYIHMMSFIRIFKKIVGVTPGSYRKEK